MVKSLIITHHLYPLISPYVDGYCKNMLNTSYFTPQTHHPPGKIVKQAPRAASAATNAPAPNTVFTWSIPRQVGVAFPLRFHCATLWMQFCNYPTIL